MTHKTPHFELEGLRNKWNKSKTLLFINDSAIKCVSGFKSANCVIHYKLPDPSLTSFGDRLILMRDNLKKIQNAFDPKKILNLIHHIIVSPEDRDLLPNAITYLNRLKIPVPQQMIKLCDYERRPLCPRFALFAKCLISSECSDRHNFNRFDRPMPAIPESGQIKIIITYVLGANDFYFRLNEFRGQKQTSGKWEKMDKTYDDIKEELNSLKNSPFNTINKFSNNEIYGIAIRGQVFRVRLTKTLYTEELYFYEEYDAKDTSQVIELFCIDFGHKIRTRSRHLFELPPHLRDLPPFVFRGHLFGIKTASK